MTLNSPDAEFLAQLDRRMPGTVFAPAPNYLEEPRGLYRGAAAAVLKPRSVADVQAIVTAAARARVGLVPYGGGTGLVGGQVRDDGPACLVVSMERMTAIREVSAADQTMVAEAGAILADVQDAAAEVDLLFPLSLAAQGSAQIGGNLSTNAGGVNVIRWGNARDLCLGIEAVLPDGALISGLKSLRKDNTGYDLRHLLIGAEGTLGIITAARLRLFPRPAEVTTGLFAVPDPGAALTILRRLQARFSESVSAFELISRTGIAFLQETVPGAVTVPTGDADWLVLVELGAGADTGLGDRFEAAIADLMDAGLVQDGTLASNEAQRRAIWQMRETIPEANRLVGAVSSHDISIPIARIPDFIEAGAGIVATYGPDLRINAFGHLGDGNLHYNVFPPRGGDKADFAPIRDDVRRAIHDLVAAFDGSISAEHGIGRAKRDELRRYGDPAKLAAMAAIKAALDPVGIMNPGAVVPGQPE